VGTAVGVCGPKDAWAFSDLVAHGLPRYVVDRSLTIVGVARAYCFNPFHSVIAVSSTSRDCQVAGRVLSMGVASHVAGDPRGEAANAEVCQQVSRDFADRVVAVRVLTRNR
jgi:hypothetical protein